MPATSLIINLPLAPATADPLTVQAMLDETKGAAVVVVVVVGGTVVVVVVVGATVVVVVVVGATVVVVVVVGYIGYQYIKTKIQPNYDVYKGMCEIVGIDQLLPKLLNSHSGGAQHLVKNTTYEYWDKVEKDSETMYRYFCSIEEQYEKTTETDYPIQKWTAGMWSLLWNAWLFEHETKVDPRLDFSWATDPIENWDQRSLYHNAGVTCACGYFYKGDYINSLPYNTTLRVNTSNCSFNYYNEILEVGKKSCLIDQI